MLRLFVGIALPPEQRLTLSILCSGLHGAKWVDPGNYHVTLRFIGGVDEGVAADIDAALAAVRHPPFTLAVAGIGTFGTDKPSVLYAGLDRSAPLVQLHDRVERALGRAGLPPEGRRFVPHITLARFQGGRPEEIRRFVEANNLLRLPAFAVDRFALVASYPTRAGSIYQDMAEYLLR